MLIKEIADGFETYLDATEHTSWSLKEDGTYYYRYEDTLLKSTLFVNAVCSMHGCDSVKSVYYYDAQRRKIKVLKYEHSTPVIAKDPPKTLHPHLKYLRYRWQEPETTLYTYAVTGQLKELRVVPRKILPDELAGAVSAVHHYRYDDRNRIVLDSIDFADHLQSVTVYRYARNWHEEHCTSFGFESYEQFFTNAQGEVIEEDSELPDDDNARAKTVNKYNDQGDIISSLHYERGKLTTTRIYVYK